MSDVPDTKTHWKQLTDPRFIGVYALPNGQDMTVTIREVQRETITMMGGKKEDHSLLYLYETKPLILNATNSKTIEKLYGPYIQDWANQRITLYASTTKMGSEMVDCLRIRAKIPPTEKPAITDARLAKALAQIEAGTFTAYKLREGFALTEAQEDRLRTLEQTVAVQ